MLGFALSVLPLVSGQKGFAAVRRAWPWPAAPKYAPFPQGPFTLAPGAPGKHADQDGRWLVLKALNAVKNPVLLEARCAAFPDFISLTCLLACLVY